MCIRDRPTNIYNAARIIAYNNVGTYSALPATTQQQYIGVKDNRMPTLPIYTMQHAVLFIIMSACIQHFRQQHNSNISESKTTECQPTNIYNAARSIAYNNVGMYSALPATTQQQHIGVKDNRIPTLPIYTICLLYTSRCV